MVKEFFCHYSIDMKLPKTLENTEKIKEKGNI